MILAWEQNVAGRRNARVKARRKREHRKQEKARRAAERERIRDQVRWELKRAEADARAAELALQQKTRENESLKGVLARMEPDTLQHGVEKLRTFLLEQFQAYLGQGDLEAPRLINLACNQFASQAGRKWFPPPVSNGDGQHVQ